MKQRSASLFTNKLSLPSSTQQCHCAALDCFTKENPFDDIKCDLKRIMHSLKFFNNQSSEEKKKISVEVIHDLRYKCELTRKEQTVRTIRVDRQFPLIKTPQPKKTIYRRFIQNRKADRQKDIYYEQNGQLFDLKLYFIHHFIPSIPQRKTKFQPKVFIGAGNNDALLKAIFKRRRRVLVVSKLAVANIVWTQKPLSQFQPGPQIPENSPYEKIGVTNGLSRQQFKKCADRDLMSYEDHQQFWSYSRVKNVKCEVIEEVRRKFAKNNFETLDISQITITNHFEGANQLGDKKELMKNLTSYYSKHGLKISQRVPTTFLVSSIESDSFRQFREATQHCKNKVWIVKPGQNSNRGSGIFLINSHSQLVRQLKFRLVYHSFILQEYLTNPFLYQGRKFDIRHFMLLTSVGGIIRGYWFEEGYLRTSSRKYSMDRLSDHFVHLTNDAIQKNCPEYQAFQLGNKLSYEEFSNYLKLTRPGAQLNQILEEMKKIGYQCFDACARKIVGTGRRINFQLFGLDFMLDEGLKPWLIEVNTNPCLETSSPIQSRVIPQVLEQTVRLAIDPYFNCGSKQTAPKYKYFFEQRL